jgi:hypothetical protein
MDSENPKASQEVSDCVIMPGFRLLGCKSIRPAISSSLLCESNGSGGEYHHGSAMGRQWSNVCPIWPQITYNSTILLGASPISKNTSSVAYFKFPSLRPLVLLIILSLRYMI